MPELLSPAGDLEKLKAAVRYGADAVYLAGQRFGMRAAAGNFDDGNLREGIDYAHAHGVKVYVTVNTAPRTHEYAALGDYLATLGRMGPDALIVGDLGVLTLSRRLLPTVPIHVSTQANVVSAEAARAFAALGASRIVLSRELSLDEIRAIRAELPREIELETFVHGAMCVSYSGRCLLSNYLSGRDAGHGACTQPCRWKYRAERVSAELIEEKRPDEPIPVYEEGGESFFMSSRDLSMIDHVEELCRAGIAAFKIEGRMKSAYYTAVITNAYRMAIDAFGRGEAVDTATLRAEVESVSHRDYDTGFYFDPPHTHPKITERDGYLREKAYLGRVLAYDETSGLALVEQKNKLSVGDRAELLVPGRVGMPFAILALYDEDMEPIASAPHPGMRFYLPLPTSAAEGDLIRGASLTKKGE
ncbi:MAG: U32 family peptidase [Clostridia bacterium]|nr:U32 family peptidase [Clostridia bacterium]